jgi:hypothetical protein
VSRIKAGEVEVGVDEKVVAMPATGPVDEVHKAGDIEARETAGKIRGEKLPTPAGYVVNHERVGEWPRDARVSHADLHKHLADEARHMDSEKARDAEINRLVALNAIVPVFE